MSNLQTYYHFKLDFQKVDQHAGGKWLIHGTKRRKDNQLESLEHSLLGYPSRECKHDIKESKDTCSIQYSRRMSRGRNYCIYQYAIFCLQICLHFF